MNETIAAPKQSTLDGDEVREREAAMGPVQVLGKTWTAHVDKAEARLVQAGV